MANTNTSIEMNAELAERIVDAFYVTKDDMETHFPEYTPEKRAELEADRLLIQDRYRKLKREGIDFASAARQARIDFVKNITP